MVCQICNKEFKSLTSLHRHLTTEHSISQKEYYHQYFPRYDRQTGDLIDYKNHTKYFESLFNSRDSFCDWILDHYKDPETPWFVIEQVLNRAKKKQNFNLPSQVCLKSLLLPSIIWFDRIYGGLASFQEMMKGNGISLRFSYLSDPVIDYSEDLTIFCDSREQKALSLRCKTIPMALNIGDYTASKPYFSNIFVERKSLLDLCGTLSGGIERFERELDKAVALDAYIVILVECNYLDALNYSANARFGQKANGSNIFYEIRRLSDKYDNIQFVFSGGRQRSCEMIETIFRLKNQVRSLDLEYLKDIGKI